MLHSCLLPILWRFTCSWIERRVALKLAYLGEFFGVWRTNASPFIRTWLPQIVVSHGVAVNSSRSSWIVRPRPDQSVPRYSARVSCKRDFDRESGGVGKKFQRIGEKKVVKTDVTRTARNVLRDVTTPHCVDFSDQCNLDSPLVIASSEMQFSRYR